MQKLGIFELFAKMGHPNVIYVLESQKDREANVDPILSPKTHVNVINFDYVF